MKQNLLVLLLVIALGIVTWDHLWPVRAVLAQTLQPDLSKLPTSGTQPGKFQIVSAPYYYTTANARIQFQGVFRIDTQTGETWEWQARPDDKGIAIRYWNPIQELVPPIR